MYAYFDRFSIRKLAAFLVLFVATGFVLTAILEEAIAYPTEQHRSTAKEIDRIYNNIERSRLSTSTNTSYDEAFKLESTTHGSYSGAAQSTVLFIRMALLYLVVDFLYRYLRISKRVKYPIVATMVPVGIGVFAGACIWALLMGHIYTDSVARLSTISFYGGGNIYSLSVVVAYILTVTIALTLLALLDTIVSRWSYNRRYGFELKS